MNSVGFARFFMPTTFHSRERRPVLTKVRRQHDR